MSTARGMLVVMLLAGSVAAEPAWSVKPPAGWTIDAKQGTELGAKIQGAFFKGLAVETETTVYLAPADPEHQRLVIARIHQSSASMTVNEVVDAWSTWNTKRAAIAGTTTSSERRFEDGRAIVETKIEGNGTRLLTTVQTVLAETGLLETLLVACGEPLGGTLCAPVIESVSVGEPKERADRDEGHTTWWWVQIGGVALVGIALLGWMRERARRVR